MNGWAFQLWSCALNVCTSSVNHVQILPGPDLDKQDWPGGGEGGGNW